MADVDTFVQRVSVETGIDARVLAAWVQAEGAYAPGGTGGFNFLNLRPYQGDPYSSVSGGGFEQFSNVNNAVTATVRRLRQPFAAPIIQAAQHHATPAQEISAIASTGWDAGHYGGPGGPNLVDIYTGIYGQNSANSQYQNPLTGTSQAGIGSILQKAIGNLPGNIGTVPGIPGIIPSLPGLPSGNSIAKGIFGATVGPIVQAVIPFLMLIGGVLIGLVGVYLIGRKLTGVDVPIPGAAGAIAGAVS